jgi:IS5 family transposase
MAANLLPSGGQRKDGAGTAVTKGRAITARADWNSDEYVLARDQRSAIESLMFTLKQGFDFGEVARRGLVAAHGELLEKALAYNLCHLTRMRQAKEAAKNDDELVLAQAA